MVGNLSIDTLESVEQFPNYNLLTEVYETDKAFDSPDNIHYCRNHCTT